MSFSFGNEHVDEENARKAKESEEPERSVSTDRSNEIVKRFGDCKAARPVKGRCHRCSVSTNFTRENFSHLKMKDNTSCKNRL